MQKVKIWKKSALLVLALGFLMTFAQNARSSDESEGDDEKLSPACEFVDAYGDAVSLKSRGIRSQEWGSVAGGLISIEENDELERLGSIAKALGEISHRHCAIDCSFLGRHLWRIEREIKLFQTPQMKNGNVVRQFGTIQSWMAARDRAIEAHTALGEHTNRGCPIPFPDHVPTMAGNLTSGPNPYDY